MNGRLPHCTNGVSIKLDIGEPLMVRVVAAYSALDKYNQTACSCKSPQLKFKVSHNLQFVGHCNLCLQYIPILELFSLALAPCRMKHFPFEIQLAKFNQNDRV